MKRLYLIIKILLMIGVYLSFLINIYALPGTEIIENANQYLTWVWKCNNWNARDLNKDNNWETNDYRYPFWPENIEYKHPVTGIRTVSTGSYTGVAYASRAMMGADTIENYNKKLKERNPEFLVGYYKTKGINEIDHIYYAGVDCSGFLSRCIGFPVLKVNPTGDLGEYYILRPTTSDFVKNIFSDVIPWESIVKGDILIREEYIDENGDRKPGHIGIAMGKPNGTTAGSEVEAIDASSNEARHNGVKLPPIVATCTYKFVNPGDAVDEIHRSDGGKRYKARRLNPPYCKRVRIKKPIYSDDRSKVISYRTIYDYKWDDSKTPREKIMRIDNAVEQGEAYIELYFTKGMAVRTNKGGSWENIEVTCSKGEKVIKVIGIKDSNENKKEFNEGGSDIKIFNGWCNGEAIGGGDGYAYAKWVGKLDTEWSEDFIGQFTLNISAISLMQDALDSNPATKAVRTEGGGWSKVRQLSIIN